MIRRKTHLQHLLIALCIASFSLIAQAIPKAAEEPDAPVTTGADAVRPKPPAHSATPAKPGKKAPHKSSGMGAKKTSHPAKTPHRKK